jgi:putative FmdB family regulatory protein
MGVSIPATLLAAVTARVYRACLRASLQARRRHCKERTMPAYDFKCKSCDVVFEITRPGSDDSPVACPSCGGDTKRVFSPLGVHFKGAGFHNTDYRKRDDSKRDEAPPKPCEAAGSGPACGGCPAASGDAS